VIAPYSSFRVARKAGGVQHLQLVCNETALDRVQRIADRDERYNQQRIIIRSASTAEVPPSFTLQRSVVRIQQRASVPH
jgi:hypothetical protein